MGRLKDVELQTLVRVGKPVAGKADGDGLTFCITKKGTAVWKLRYRFHGRPRWITLGQYPELTLRKAREKALKCGERFEPTPLGLFDMMTSHCLGAACVVDGKPSLWGHCEWTDKDGDKVLMHGVRSDPVAGKYTAVAGTGKYSGIAGT